MTHRLAASWRITPVSLMAVGSAAQGGTLPGERERADGKPGRRASGPGGSASEPGAGHQRGPGVREGALREPERRGSPLDGRAADAARRLEDPAGPGGTLGRGPARRRGEPAPPDDIAGGLQQVAEREAILADLDLTEPAVIEQAAIAGGS